MATYLELISVANDSDLQDKVLVACTVAADTIRLEAPATTNHANRLLWAKSVYSNPRQASRDVLWSVIIANRTLSVAQILGAADAAIQSNVDAVVDVFANGV